jgi:hypothetical protein
MQGLKGPSSHSNVEHDWHFVKRMVLKEHTHTHIWGNEANLLSLFDQNFHPNQCLVKYVG